MLYAAWEIQRNLSLEIYAQHYARLDTGWNYPHVNSPFSRLYLVTGGTGMVRMPGLEYHLEPGYVYLLPLHTDLALSCPGRLEKLYFHFRLELFGRDVFRHTKKALVQKTEPGYIMDLVRLSNAPGAAEAALLRSRILELLSGWIDISPDAWEADMKMMDKYGEMLAFINRNIRAGIAIDDLARFSYLTAKSLPKQFKRDTGVSLKRYLEERLADRAKEKLILTSRRINEIAADLSFGDEFYFSRFIKKMTGVPPREYRKRNRI